MAKRKVVYKNPDDDMPAWTPFIRRPDNPKTPGAEIWRNSRYEVHVRFARATKDPTAKDMIHLSMRRLDRGQDISYQDKMRIKDALIGPEYDFMERYPARSEEVNSANQYHLWSLADPTFRWPVGWSKRRVSKVSINGSKQAEFEEEPEDIIISREEFELRLEEDQL